MMPSSSLSDINEDDINKLDPALLTTLLIDRSLDYIRYILPIASTG